MFIQILWCIDQNPIIEPPVVQQNENITMEHFANQEVRGGLPEEYRNQIEYASSKITI